MYIGSDIAYTYDGSYEGFLCCVYRSVKNRENPLSILPGANAPPTLFRNMHVESESDKAAVVADAFEKKASCEAMQTVRLAFLTCLPEKELHLLRFIRLGFQVGPVVSSMLSDARVARIDGAIRHLTGESHLYKGFVRFSDFGGVLVAVIEPKNQVLPLLEEHFCERFNCERFILYDRTHAQALVYKDGVSGIYDAPAFVLPSASENELSFRALWKTFYESIAIKERYNPVCRRSHMPKRYWDAMTEFWPDQPAPTLQKGPISRTLKEK